ncbi:TPA: hypothetical protein N0F65_005818 [Lagenidium giganteum]|uniref:Uncharacterized protein n=1 Tax=Lagenidium giganteum TaxID=4803 RepID=A0AAV2YTF4_9STRA|nr:TPA: hypothetical protein N0F65_005818 [Lagenidium giganteum]
MRDRSATSLYQALRLRQVEPRRRTEQVVSAKLRAPTGVHHRRQLVSHATTAININRAQQDNDDGTDPRQLQQLLAVPRHQLLVLLWRDGSWTVIKSTTHRVLLHVPPSIDHQAHSIVDNKLADALVVITATRDSALACQSILFRSILAGKAFSQHILRDECLAWPSFVEFDASNGKIMVCNPSSRRIAVWDMKSYELCFEHVALGPIVDVKFSRELLLVLLGSDPAQKLQKVAGVDLQFGEVRFEVALECPLRLTQLEFVHELCGRLLVKQRRKPVQVYHIRSKRVVSLADTSDVTAENVFLDQRDCCFSVLRNKTIERRDADGNVVATAEIDEVVAADFRIGQVTRFEQAITIYVAPSTKAPGRIHVVCEVTGAVLASSSVGSLDAQDESPVLQALTFNCWHDELYTVDQSNLVRTWKMQSQPNKSIMQEVLDDVLK